MFDHISITVTDVEASASFYDAIMSALGVVKVGHSDEWLGYGERSGSDNPERAYLSIRKSSKPDGTPSRHWCFKASTRAQVDTFWKNGIANGGTDNGAPGLRSYHASYYAAFVIDRDGNRLEAVCHTEA